MLVEREYGGGWVTLVSPKLQAIGVPHGFTTAIGVSGTRWSVKSASDLSGVLADGGRGDRAVVMGRQVHGCDVSDVAARRGGGCDGFDGHVTDRSDELVAVRTADCVPVLLSAADGRCVAAVHAGWRGLAAGVIESAVGAMRRIEPSVSIVAAVGPCIAFEAYEVGEELAERLPASVVRREGWPRPHLDLKAEALRRLLAVGVADGQVDVSASCTFSDPSRFGSYRRDRHNPGGCGHQAAYIGPVD